jgi:hypothetical protein
MTTVVLNGFAYYPVLKLTAVLRRQGFIKGKLSTVEKLWGCLNTRKVFAG